VISKGYVNGFMYEKIKKKEDDDFFIWFEQRE